MYSLLLYTNPRADVLTFSLMLQLLFRITVSKLAYVMSPMCPPGWVKGHSQKWLYHPKHVPDTEKSSVLEPADQGQKICFTNRERHHPDHRGTG